MSLKEQGFRFVLLNAKWLWVHPAEIQTTDRDCTDMDDMTFENLVREIG